MCESPCNKKDDDIILYIGKSNISNSDNANYKGSFIQCRRLNTIQIFIIADQSV